MTNRRVLIDSLPKERLSEDNFKIVEDRIPSIEENENITVSLIPPEQVDELEQSSVLYI